MNNIIRRIINFITRNYFFYRKYIYTREEILSYQDTFLSDVMQKNKDTFVGKKYHFGDVVDYKSFKKNIPVFHYDEYKEYIYMSVQWQQHIICHDVIDFWAKTSGTTDDYQKYIPVTQRYLKNNHYKWWKDTLSNYVHNNPDTKLFEWKSIVLWWPLWVNECTWANNIGYISAILQKNNHRFVQWLFVEPSQNISFLSDRSTKIAMIIDTCKHQNVTSILWVTSWSVFLMKNLVDMLWVRYVDDIWPDYELFLTGGMDYRPLDLTIRNLFSKHITIRQAYNASEWYFGVQVSNSIGYMQLLCCHDVYYEFLTQEDYDIWNYENIINIYNICVWINYVIIITTSSWLYRYIIGDTIQFHDVDKLLFEITGRTKSYLDSFGERVRENHTHTAIQKVCNTYHVSIIDYHVGVIKNTTHDGSGYHHWMIDLDAYDIDTTFTECNFTIDKLEEQLDDILKRSNLFYEWKRSGNILLQKPVVQLVPKGTFAKRFASKWKLWWQHKIPKLRNDDIIIKEIINLL